MPDTLIADLIMEFDRLDLLARAFQVSEGKRQPDFFRTFQGLVIPVATPTQVSPKEPNRNTILLQNTGTDQLYVGNSYRDCQTGKALGGGGQLSLTTRQAVWVYLPVATPESVTTLDLLETLYAIPFSGIPREYA